MFWRAMAAGGFGFAAYQLLQKRNQKKHAAYASHQVQESDTDVRDAGPDAMRDPSDREWSKTDEELDQSFPASDPPANY
ncbi:MAG: hypothetical protein AAF291_11355 [Pseudomonadota bacterium]